MGSMESDIGEIHLPERWVVLQDALREIQASANPENSSGSPAQDEEDGDPHPAESVQRNRDAEDTRSRNQPVRPSSGRPGRGSQQPRGGTH